MRPVPLTKEHALPRWLSVAVPRPGDHWTMIATVRGLGRREQSREWDATSVDLTCRQVCAGRNKGWMNDLEKAARPWLTPRIRGEAVDLPPGAQGTVVAWAAKTATMLQYVQSPPRPATPERLQWLFDKR